MPVKYVCHKHPRVSNLHTNPREGFRCKIQMCLCLSPKCLWVSFDYTCLFLFWKKCAISFRMLKGWWTCFEQGVTVKNNWCGPKNNEQTTLFHHVVHIRLPCVVILPSFCSHIYSSSSVVICPLHACPAQQGSPGRTKPYWRVWSSPTIPFPPSPSHSHSVCLLLSHHVPAYMPRQSALWPGRW